MSSTNKGSDDGAREDELDLGQEDHELATPTNGHADRNYDDPVDKEEKEDEQQDDQLLHNDAPISVAASDDELSQRVGTLTDTASTQGHPIQVAGSVDDTISIPDDTPSLHVCWPYPVLLYGSGISTDLVSHRDLCARLQAVARSPFERLRVLAPALPTVPSTYGFSRGYHPHRSVALGHLPHI